MLNVVYKKGKSRARDRESEEEHLVQPKRAKTSASVRSARIDYIQQEVVDINRQQISYKDRRIEQEKNSNHFAVCEKITQELKEIEARQGYAPDGIESPTTKTATV